MVYDYIKALKLQAKEKHVPIIQDEVADFLVQFIHEHEIKKVLEIGTASSYSAHVMASSGADIHTIERDEKMIALAQDNLKSSPLKDNITLYPGDALNFKTSETFDLIFIDGAKSKYKHFFTSFQDRLNPDGYIICDNMFFHHLNPQEVSRNTRQLLKKLQDFTEYLLNDTQFKTHILDIGDGLSISSRVIQ
ncbi:MAG: O-methyltransferase [Acholeplasmataceae bacterium]